MEWVEKEVKDVNFGDKRLAQRMEKVLSHLGNKPNCSIPQACGGWSETIAAYRFFDNEKVTLEQVKEPHYKATLERIVQQEVVLLPQDTTELIKVTNKGAKGLGTLKKIEKEEMFLHPVIAITPERIPLGTVFMELWKRGEKGVSAEHATKPIEEKESYRWIEGYQAACDIQAQAQETLIVSIADREGDIYELFIEMLDYAPSQRAAWIVRAAQNRLVEDETQRKLKEQLQKSPVLGETELTIPARNGKPAGEIRQAIHAKTVTLKPPDRTKAIKGFKLPSITINAVLAEEINPTKGEKAITWLLLTSLPVNSLEQALTILQWYTARWEIEIFFRVLKQGCQIEKLQFETEKRLVICLMLYMIIAWRVLYVTLLGREYPNIDCEMVFDKEEWQTLYIVQKQQQAPKEPLPLSVMVFMLAELGGFLGRKCDGFPGPKPIWIGLQRLKDFVWAIQRYQAVMSFS